jgi:hypothetical protein
MIGIPSYLAFLLGGLFGVLVYGPIKRWIVGLRRALRDQARPSAGSSRQSPLLLIFMTMHPAPWLLILGTLFAGYQLAFGPLPWMWLQMIGGIMLGATLTLLFETRLAKRMRS